MERTQLNVKPRPLILIFNVFMLLVSVSSFSKNKCLIYRYLCTRADKEREEIKNSKIGEIGEREKKKYDGIAIECKVERKIDRAINNEDHAIQGCGPTQRLNLKAGWV